MIVFSHTSLRTFLQLHQDVLPTDPGSDMIGSDIVVRHNPVHTLIFHRDDQATSQLVLIQADALVALRDLGERATGRALERIDRVAREFSSPPLSLPPLWHKYQENSRVAFFALPRSLNSNSLRWIAERLPNGDTVFWCLTSRDAEMRLADYAPNHALAETASSTWKAQRADALGQLPPSEPGRRYLQQSVDLDIVGGGAVSRFRTFTAWKPLLTPKQLEVIDYSGLEALKVRGAAGTGKTLTLQLKALHDVYTADERDEDIRVLYLTHSWALTELVDNSFRAMDERGLMSGHLDVMPLTWLREALMGPLPEGMEILGDDSLQGKREQLSLISQTIDEIVERDWSTYVTTVSDYIRSAAEADRFDSRRVSLCWMLMREFAEVIDANRLKLGMDSLRKYLDIPREPWMTTLDEKSDREFAYAVYRRYVKGLAEEGSLTTDQALDDFRRYLESYSWNIRRVTDGYDLVLVDEFHLFNDTERYLIHLLTRDAEAPPRLILALDPQQSAFALLTGLAEGTLSRAATESLGGPTQTRMLDLLVVHRFSSQVHAFVRLIHESFPNLIELGEDWSFDVSKTQASRSDGVKPRVLQVSTQAEACQSALDLAQQSARSATGDDRVAVVATGAEELEALRSALGSDSVHGGASRYTLLESREDVERLNYEQRSIVIGSAEYCAGLQFAHVVVVAFSGTPLAAGGASAQRAALSELYLAVTRAEKTVTLVTWGADGAVADIASRALAAEVAVAISVV